MKTIRCPQCNLVCWKTISFCSRCNFDIQSLIESETAAETEQIGSFERNAVAHSVQNSGSFYERKSQNFNNDFQEDQTSYQSNNQNNFHSSNSRNPYENRRGNNAGNFRTPNQFGGQTVKTKKGLAIASLVLGILGMPWFTMIIASLFAALLSLILGTAGIVIGLALLLLIPVIALISGIVSLKRVKRQPHEFGGKGLAIAGICCSGFSLVFLPIVAAIAIPNLLAARRAANEGSAISSIKTLAKAESAYRTTNATPCADLDALEKRQLIDGVLKSGEKSGYRFVMSKLPTAKQDCAITATPISDSTGSRSFYYSTEDGEIRARKYDGKMADMNDEPIN